MKRTKSFYKTFAGLLALLALTVGLSFLDLGPWGGMVSFGIAAAKAALVVLIFMEVEAGSTLVRVFCGAGILWLGILIVGTLHDYLTRSPLPFPMW